MRLFLIVPDRAASTNIMDTMLGPSQHIIHVTVFDNLLPFISHNLNEFNNQRLAQTPGWTVNFGLGEPIISQCTGALKEPQPSRSETTITTSSRCHYY